MFEWRKIENSIGDTVNTNANSVTPMVIFSNKKKTLEIHTMPATIGKNSDMADVSFFHDSVSNQHCRVYCNNRQVIIIDLGTPTGTFVNGRKIEADTPCVIDEGDKLAIGKVKFDVSINYEEIANRERIAMIEAKRNEAPQSKTYTLAAREVSNFEYDESEVVFVSCGFEPLKKKVRYTQEVRLSDIREAQAEQDASDTFIPKKVYEEASVEPEAVNEPEMSPSIESRPELVPEDDDVTDIVFSLTGIIEDTGAIEEILVDHFPFTIGRKKSMNDYVISTEGVSRRHLSIIQKEGSYYIIDLNSTNGVKVNGIRIPPDQEYKVQAGDNVRISGRSYTVGFTGKR